ncbi:MAG: topoisomerase DNA-binding C4 zinc finger domain-containing protein [Elusimicrobiota bacterium]
MTTLIYIIGFFVGTVFLIEWLFSKISDAFKGHREKIRDQVATEVLNGLNIETVIEGYKNKLAHIKHEKTDPIREEIDGLMRQLWGRDVELMNECPKCKEGYLVVRKGKFGKFMGCTKYPKCDYTNNIVQARAELKKSINEQVIDDIRQAYLHL